MINCGKCHEKHETVAQVRTCYGARISIDPGKVTGVAAHVDKKLAAAPDLRKASSWSIPAGRYAVPGGTQPLDFFRVKIPTKGHWEGWIFVDLILGGHDPIPLKGTRAQDALKRITAAGVVAAAQKYGQEIGECSKCGRSLTDAVSRAAGRGPECRAKYGMEG